MSELVIRSLTAADLPAVGVADRLCFGAAAWTEDAFAAELDNPVAYYRVAEVDGHLVGFIGAHLVADEGHITTLCVHPAARRRRVGERLLVDVLREATRRGIRRVTLEVRESNQAARRLYEKYGFRPVGRRPGYYLDNGEDALVMGIEDLGRPEFLRLLAERGAALERCDARTRD